MRWFMSGHSGSSGKAFGGRAGRGTSKDFGFRSWRNRTKGQIIEISSLRG